MSEVENHREIMEGGNTDSGSRVQNQPGDITTRAIRAISFQLGGQWGLRDFATRTWSAARGRPAEPCSGAASSACRS